MRIKDLSLDKISFVVANSKSLKQSLKQLGYSDGGSSSKVLRKILDDNNIDYSHFSRFKKPIIKQCVVCEVKFTCSPKYEKQRFCSRSCANKIRIRHTHPNWHGASVCACGNKRSYGSANCHQCKKLRTFNTNKQKTLKDIKGKGNSRIKWSMLRKLAAQAMIIYNEEKKCKICGFDIVVEVCHIKEINEFPESALVGDVNSKKNLVYLCPNHHAMMDKGLIDLLRW